MDVAEYIRNRIRTAREQANFSQQKLAELYGVTQSTISGIERGRVEITAAELARLAETLRKPITYFYPGQQTTLTEQEQDLLYAFRGLPDDTRLFILASLKGQFELYQQAKRIENMPKDQQEHAAMDAFAQYLLKQGIRVKIDEAGYPVLDAGEISAILETMDQKEQKALAKAVYRLQKLQQ